MTEPNVKSKMNKKMAKAMKENVNVTSILYKDLDKRKKIGNY